MKTLNLNRILFISYTIIVLVIAAFQLIKYGTPQFFYTH